MDKDYNKETWIVDKNISLKSDEECGLDSWKVVHTSTGGHIEDEVEIRVLKNGTLIISDDGDYIHLYPTQAYALYDMLNRMNTMNEKET